MKATEPRESKLTTSIVKTYKNNVGELKMTIRMIEKYPDSEDEKKLLPFYKAALELIEIENKK